MDGIEQRRCARCRGWKPLTDEHWRFHKTGRKAGNVTGYCVPCQAEYLRQRDRRLTGTRLLVRRLQQLGSARRARGADPTRLRGSKWEAAVARMAGVAS